MSDQRKRVWILGAGFSYPLGAPLFHQLFSEPMVKMVEMYSVYLMGKHAVREEDRRRLVEMRAAYECYIGGHCSALSDCHPSPSLWSNPEQFLQCICDLRHGFKDTNPMYRSVLALAEQSIKKASEYREWVKPIALGESANLDFIIRGAISELALEVSVFLEGSDFSAERFNPHARWLESLNTTNTDSIVTFNYDLAVERLAKNLEEDFPIHVLTGATDVDSVNLVEGTLPIAKLHGSVGSTLDAIEFNAPATADELSDLITSSRRIAGICIPGPQKANASFNPIWDKACEYIQDADEIHIVGYRFPETDSLALNRIRSAVLNSKKAQIIYVVLGDDVNSPHIRRLESLFSNLGERPRIVKAVPRFAQDHLLCVSSGKY
jgi:hypothetical protein